MVSCHTPNIRGKHGYFTFVKSSNCPRSVSVNVESSHDVSAMTTDWKTTLKLANDLPEKLLCLATFSMRYYKYFTPSKSHFEPSIIVLPVIARLTNRGSLLRPKTRFFTTGMTEKTTVLFLYFYCVTLPRKSNLWKEKRFFTDLIYR